MLNVIRDVEMWKLPDIQIYVDPRIKGVRTQKNHKKRKITGTLEQQFHHIPRILKSDIRRQYAVMFSNVYNSGDCSFMRSFCSIFVRCDTSVSILKRGDFAPFLICTFYLTVYLAITESCENHTGFDACATVWEVAMNEAPDLVFKLNSNQLKLRSDGTSVVSANFTLSGTKFFTIDESELTQFQAIISKASCQSPAISSSGSSSTCSDSEQEWMEIHDMDSISSASSSSSSINGDGLQSGYDLDGLSSVSNRFEVNPVDFQSIMELTTTFKEDRKQKNIEVESMKENLLTVPIAYKFDGRVAIHLDTDSKFHHVSLEFGALSL